MVLVGKTYVQNRRKPLRRKEFLSTPACAYTKKLLTGFCAFNRRESFAQEFSAQ
jgi:hypothetical protein